MARKPARRPILRCLLLAAVLAVAVSFGRAQRERGERPHDEVEALDVGHRYAVVARRWRTRYGWVPYYRLGRTLEMWGPARRRTSCSTRARLGKRGRRIGEAQPRSSA